MYVVKKLWWSLISEKMFLNQFEFKNKLSNMNLRKYLPYYIYTMLGEGTVTIGYAHRQGCGPGCANSNKSITAAYVHSTVNRTKES